MSGPFGSSQWMYSSGGFYPQEIEQSLRFNDDDSAYLSWTPASAGNRKTWTWSGWYKKSTNDIQHPLFYNGTEGGAEHGFRFRNDDNSLDFFRYSGGFTYRLRTSALYRDVSAWYHIVAVLDTTQATASDRVKLYVNGEEITSFQTSTYPSQNAEFETNNTVLHRIGNFSTSYNDGYLAEVNFIDGQALDPTDFGEFKSGVWVAKEYTGSYGTNGFYLPFKQTTVANGFNAITYDTSNVSYPKPVTGVGFQPDLVWIKSRTQAYNHYLFDSVRGAGVTHLNSNTTGAEGNDGVTDLDSFDSDGFTIGAGAGIGVTSAVAWCWDAGSGSPVSNTDGSITSTIKANPAYGFSVITWTGNNTAGATIGHGLNSAPEMFITFRRNVGDNHPVYHSALGNTKAVHINLTDGTYTSSGYWNDTSPTSSVISLGVDSSVNWSAYNYVGYAFHSVSGYSSIGSYSGSGSSGNSITGLGFKPAFVMVKRTDSTGSWVLWDNTRDTTNPNQYPLYPNLSNAESFEATDRNIQFDSNGFTLLDGNNDHNASGGSYIYMAFADTRDAAFWRDLSGNSNDWQPNYLQNSDVVPDSPTNNFCTLNPVDKRSGSNLNEANLFIGPVSGAHYWARGTIKIPNEKKIYLEALAGDNGSGSIVAFFGIINENSNPDLGAMDNGVACNSADFYKHVDGSGSSQGSSVLTAGDIVGLAFDMPNSTMTIYKNGSVTTNAVSFTPGEFYLYLSIFFNYGGTPSWVLNAGQDSSFGGRKASQGNTDDNGVGDFFYAPPSGYLALCTANLPDPAIDPAQDDIPADYFNTVLYTGNGSTQSITGVGFQPDWVWIKSRSEGASAYTGHNVVQDAVRGTGTNSALITNGTFSESGVGYSDAVTAFNSDGFSLGSRNQVNYNSSSFVAWNWLAGNGTSSNTDGSITSTVSVNEKAGFSVVSYTGNNTSGQSVGHGLGAAPALVITKRRDGANDWFVKHKSLATNLNLILNSTSATYNTTVGGGGGIADLTSDTVFSFVTGSSDTSNSNPSGTMIAYCFAEVEGYSKFGSYTGNGSTDGPMLHLGFEPAFFLAKRTDGVENWFMIDNARHPYNDGNIPRLLPNASNAEAEDASIAGDFLSNGFKIRATQNMINTSGANYIYMAFAESPFKYSNAR